MCPLNINHQFVLYEKFCRHTWYWKPFSASQKAWYLTRERGKEACSLRKSIHFNWNNFDNFLFFITWNTWLNKHLVTEIVIHFITPTNGKLNKHCRHLALLTGTTHHTHHVKERKREYEPTVSRHHLIITPHLHNQRDFKLRLIKTSHA